MEMCFNEPVMCTEFQLDGSMCMHFYSQECKMKEKNEEIIAEFCSLISWIGWCDLLQIWYEILLAGGISAANLFEFR